METTSLASLTVDEIAVDEYYEQIDEELLSPRSKQRYRSGTLEHRCGFGFLKSATIQSKYFRLRDHGLLGYITQDEHTPSLEIMFTLFTTIEQQPPYHFLLRSIDIIQTATWFKVDDPIEFKTKTTEEMDQWVVDIQKKLDYMKRNEETKAYRKKSMIPVHNADDLVFTATDDPPYYRTFENKFFLLNEIGEGSFSIVRKCINRLSGEMCAVKCSKHTPALLEEVSILKELHHCNIVNLHGVYKVQDMFYIVMDYMGDGDLCDKLIDVQKFSEEKVRYIIKQITQGIEYIHNLNIIHRDIKPENILLHQNEIKIADFGLAKRMIDISSQFQKGCGTPEYAAPELLYGRPYGTKSDIFSLGVVMYVLLFGSFPFTVASAAALQRLERFSDGQDVRDMTCLHPSNPIWKSITPQAQDALRCLLVINPNDRISASEFLQHPWLKGETPYVSIDDSKRIENCIQQGVMELLCRGVEVLKHNQSGKSSHPHRTILRYDASTMSITWTPGLTLNQNPKKKLNEKRKIYLKNIINIINGCKTNAFLKIKKKINKKNCFSIETNTRTLDIETELIQQQIYLINGIKYLIKCIK